MRAASIFASVAASILIFAGCGSSSTTNGADAAVDAGPPGPPDFAGADLSLGTNQCEKPADCRMPTVCVAPGTPAGCGTCRQPTNPCMTDGDCSALGALWICEPGACTCGGEKECVMGCADDDDCTTGMVCRSDARCVFPTCKTDADCAPNLRCGTSGQCERKPCTSDADCAPYCVDGLCYDTPGTCTPPTA